MVELAILQLNKQTHTNTSPNPLLDLFFLLRGGKSRKRAKESFSFTLFIFYMEKNSPNGLSEDQKRKCTVNELITHGSYN